MCGGRECACVEREGVSVWRECEEVGSVYGGREGEEERSVF